MNSEELAEEICNNFVPGMNFDSFAQDVLREQIKEALTQVEREAYEKAAQRIETMPTSMTKYQAAEAIRKLSEDHGKR